LSMESLWTLYARAGFVFGALYWLILGTIAALWWVPSYLGEARPPTWKFGALCLLGLWGMVFNHWPRLGTRRFFRESRFLKLEVSLLVAVSALFAVGFAVGA